MQFTAHNIRLDDGTFTKPEIGYSIDQYPHFTAAKRMLRATFPEDEKDIRIADLGCLEGGYAVEFARMGFQVVGVEVRESNIAACNYVKSKTKLPNLTFVKDDVVNIARHGSFDAIFCCGLLYHLDNPKAFLETLSSVTKRLLILQTHFSVSNSDMESNPNYTFKGLLPISENEGLFGRWYTEFEADEDFKNRESSKWSSWDNRRSFWPQREFLLQAISDVGFDLVMEQYDSLAPNIAESMLRGYYKNDSRGTFIGIKTGSVAKTRRSP
jgi:SAM-dependent methyltransferase